MKKLLTMLFTVVLCFAVVGCNETENSSSQDNTNSTSGTTSGFSVQSKKDDGYPLSDYVGVYEDVYYDQYTKTYVYYYVVLNADGRCGLFMQDTVIGTWDKSGIYIDGNKQYDIWIDKGGERQELWLKNEYFENVYYMTEDPADSYFPVGFEGDPFGEGPNEGPMGTSSLDPTCFVGSWSANVRNDSNPNESTETWSNEDDYLYVDIYENDGVFTYRANGRRNGRELKANGNIQIISESGNMFAYVYDGVETDLGTYDIVQYKINPREEWDPDKYSDYQPCEVYIYPTDSWYNDDATSVVITYIYMDRFCGWVGSSSYTLVKTVG